MARTQPRLGERTSGVLLHITSLPGAACCGDLGDGARDFVDLLAAAGQSWWQVLPINPIDKYNSPYSSISAFAAEPLLIDLNAWVEEGLLDKEDCDYAPCGPSGRAAYAAARDFRSIRWRKAFAKFKQIVRTRQRDEVDRFIDENRTWLEDHALFCALCEKLGTNVWTEWPAPLRDREQGAMDDARRELRDAIAYHVFLQYEFERQWQRLKAYCHERGVGLIGDLPIYVSPGSVDTWANREYFIVDETGRPSYVAGVPGDHFNPDGQRWNSPLYRWDIMQRDKFSWWMRRLENTFQRFDAVRLDHFIGFHNYFQLPADVNSTVGAGWFPAPGYEFFSTVRANFPQAQLIAEDLGAVSDGVKKLRDAFSLPGMNVLQFTYCDRRLEEGDVASEWRENSIVCTGTHDTNTVLGWWQDDVRVLPGMETPPLDYELITRSLGLVAPAEPEAEGEAPAAAEESLSDVLPPTEVTDQQFTHAAMETVLRSAPHTAIFPMQDLLGMGTADRMNRPGVAEDNWRWRLRWEDVPDDFAGRLLAMTEEAERTR